MLALPAPTLEVLFEEGRFQLYTNGDVFYNPPYRRDRRRIHNMNAGPVEQIKLAGNNCLRHRLDDLDVIAAVWSHYITHGTIG